MTGIEQEEQEKGNDWNTLIASLISNTSLSVEDVKNLTIVEFEELLAGMDSYNKEVSKQINAGDTDRLENQEAVSYLLEEFGA